MSRDHHDYHLLPSLPPLNDEHAFLVNFSKHMPDNFLILLLIMPPHITACTLGQNLKICKQIADKKSKQTADKQQYHIGI